MSNFIDSVLIERYKKEAEELNITLQEYLSFLILKSLDNLSVTTYQGDR